MEKNILCAIAILFFASITNAQWTCTLNEDCLVTGSVCVEGSCRCPLGEQVVLGGTRCASIAPYHASSCIEDFQCSNLFNNFECRRDDSEDAGQCFCQPGFHYLHGRCWPTIDYGEECSSDDECLSLIMTDPNSLKCDGTCQCADGYYMRQRGECRKIGYAVGDRCVLDEDCQFNGGVCDSFTCNSQNDASSRTSQPTANTTRNVTPYNVANRAHFASCSALTPCAEPYVCSVFGVCVCPPGYYQDGGNMCLAELGSPSTQQQCQGLFAVVENGICTCPANFFYDEDMRNCIKVARTTSDACVSDVFCRTFGAWARCGAPQLWGMRGCECDPERAVWDASRQICRLFASIGEQCEVNSDCLAGELEIQCVIGDDGIGYCACPEGLLEVDGLCLTTGLGLGDSCQATVECTETENTECSDGVCSCSNGYQAVDDFCAPIIGGTCSQDSDCVIENTICYEETSTCQCGDQFVAYDDECWPVASGIDSTCNVTAQCVASLGENSLCLSGVCVCETDYHHRDGRCWPRIGLFQGCGRSSECFLTQGSDRTECRNSLCQCTFDFEYSEQQRTCRSSATNIVAGISSILSVIYIFIR